MIRRMLAALPFAPDSRTPTYVRPSIRTTLRQQMLRSGEVSRGTVGQTAVWLGIVEYMESKSYRGASVCGNNACTFNESSVFFCVADVIFVSNTYNRE